MRALNAESSLIPVMTTETEEMTRALNTALQEAVRVRAMQQEPQQHVKCASPTRHRPGYSSQLVEHHCGIKGHPADCSHHTCDSAVSVDSSSGAVTAEQGPVVPTVVPVPHSQVRGCDMGQHGQACHIMMDGMWCTVQAACRDLCKGSLCWYSTAGCETMQPPQPHICSMLSEL